MLLYFIAYIFISTFVALEMKSYIMFPFLVPISCNAYVTMSINIDRISKPYYNNIDVN